MLSLESGRSKDLDRRTQKEKAFDIERSKRSISTTPSFFFALIFLLDITSFSNEMFCLGHHESYCIYSYDMFIYLFSKEEWMQKNMFLEKN